MDTFSAKLPKTRGSVNLRPRRALNLPLVRMKLLKAIAYVAATSIFFVVSTGIASAAPLSWEITHRNGDDTSDVTSLVNPPTVADGDSYIPYFQGRTDPGDPIDSGIFNYANIGSGIGFMGGNLYVTPSTIETPQGHLTDTLAGLVSTTTESSDISSLQSEIVSLGAPLSISTFMANQGSTTPLVATSTFNGFMSGAMVTKLAALSTSTPVIQRTRVTTDANGNYTWTFPASFGSAPIVSAVVEDASSAFSNVQVTSASSTGVTIHAGKLTSALGILTLAMNASVPVDLIAVSA